MSFSFRSSWPTASACSSTPETRTTSATGSATRRGRGDRAHLHLTRQKAWRGLGGALPAYSAIRRGGPHSPHAHPFTLFRPLACRHGCAHSTGRAKPTSTPPQPRTGRLPPARLRALCRRDHPRHRHQRHHRYHHRRPPAPGPHCYAVAPLFAPPPSPPLFPLESPLVCP